MARSVLSLGFVSVFLMAVGMSGCDRHDSGNSATQPGTSAQEVSILNVSYDPTREFYAQYNTLFASHWQKKTGVNPTIRQSHGGSGKQARAVIDGLSADVVTLALAYDIDEIAERSGRVDVDWQKRFPNNSSPYTSTIVFLVRKGNPKGIKDWDDIVKDGTEIITPNPKTGGGARWNYLASWGFALSKNGNDPAKAREFVGRLFKNVKILDSGARGATTTFVQRRLGDVLITWENEALLATKDASGADLQIVTPSLSILCEPPVAVVDKVVKKRGTQELATEYLNHLYSDEAQELAAKHFYRPRNAEIAAKHEGQFKNVKLFTIDEVFGGWAKAQKEHFADGGIYDQIAKANN